MQLQEQRLPKMSRYPKRTGIPVNDVESWLNDHPEKRLESQPNNGTGRSKARRDLTLRPLPPNSKEIKALRAKAKKESRAILKKLDAKPVVKTPAPILEATYREFKRIAKNHDATIEQVLAVKDGQ